MYLFIDYIMFELEIEIVISGIKQLVVLEKVEKDID